MKKFLIAAILSSIALWGCATTVDTANMSPSQGLAYAMKLYNNENYDMAIKEFQAIVLQYAGNAAVDDAQYYLGMSRYQQKQYILAAYEFSKLIKNMPSSKHLSDAQYMLAQCYYKLSPNYALDQKYTRKSIEEFQAFIDFFPTNSRVPEAEKKISEMNTKLAHKEYHIAYIYQKLEYYTAALMYYNFVQEDYHETKYAPMAQYAEIELLVDRDRKEEALAAANKFIKKYPNDSNIEKVKNIQKSLEEILTALK